MKNFAKLHGLVWCLAVLCGASSGCLGSAPSYDNSAESSDERADVERAERTTAASTRGTPVSHDGSLFFEFDGYTPFARIKIPSAKPTKRDFRLELDCTFAPAVRIGTERVIPRVLASEEDVYYTTAMHIVRAGGPHPIELDVTSQSNGWSSSANVPPAGSSCMLRTSAVALFDSLVESRWEYSGAWASYVDKGVVLKTFPMAASTVRKLSDNDASTGWTPNSDALLLAHGAMAATKLRILFKPSRVLSCPNVTVGEYGLLRVKFHSLIAEGRRSGAPGRVECNYDLIDISRGATTDVLVDARYLFGDAAILEAHLYGSPEVEFHHAVSPYIVVQ